MKVRVFAVICSDLRRSLHPHHSYIKTGLIAHSRQKSGFYQTGRDALQKAALNESLKQASTSKRQQAPAGIRSRMSRRPQHRDDEEDELDDAIVHADIPNTFRELRACMTCSLIKTFTQFYDTGCENCAFLQMADNRQRVAECTSAYFEGMIAMMQPKESWVAKWQRIVRLIPGIYAVSVSGELPESIKRFLEDRNIPYRVQN